MNESVQVNNRMDLSVSSTIADCANDGDRGIFYQDALLSNYESLTILKEFD